jgi:hypothetical protein
LAGDKAADGLFARALLAAVLLLLGLQLHLALVMSANWDEFFFLSHIYDYARGELSQPINTFHVHLFQWLPRVPGWEVNQIVAGRLTMLAAEAGTVFCLVRIARRFATLEAALAAAVVYLSVGEVVVHGASFRTDPLSAFLLMASLWLIVCSRLRPAPATGAAVLAALGALITVKAVFYLPALALAAIWRVRTSAEPRRLLVHLLAGGLVGATVLVGLFLWHRASLAPAPFAAAVDGASSAYDKTLGASGLFPRWPYLAHSLLGNPVQWALILAGVAFACAEAARRDQRWRGVALLGMALPLATLAVYRNAFPYFYVFMLAPACVVAALPMQRILERRAIALAIAGVLVFDGAMHYAAYVQHDQRLQRAVVTTVHQMFARPVAYIDRASMIGGFPQAGFFMSTWGMENYRAAGRPVLADNAARRAPAFVIVAHPALEAAVQGSTAPNPLALLAPDAAFLRENFIPHWGPVWVAGKTVAEGAFVMRIPGTYTLEAPGPVRIDGQVVAPGQTLSLKAGSHRLEGEPKATLRLGEHLYRPPGPPPAGELFWPF